MIKTILFFISLSLYIHSDSSNWDVSRPDSHAPIGIMGDHTHQTGSVMISIRQMNMTMETLYNNTNKVSDSSALSSYSMIPSDMNMNMTMIGTMWGYSENLTFMAMINYKSNKMNMKSSMMTNSNESSGFGDLKLSSIYKINEKNQSQWLLNTGINIPIGSINEENKNGNRLAYGMQLGSGTYDLFLGTTYILQTQTFSYGGQLNSLLRMGKNSNGYSLGNEYTATAWIQKKISSEISGSIRGTAQLIEDINGSDDSLNLAMSPSNSTEQGRLSSSIGIGINYITKYGIIKGHRVAFEYNIPIYYNTNSIQLVNQKTLTLGIQKAL